MLHNSSHCQVNTTTFSYLNFHPPVPQEIRVVGELVSSISPAISRLQTSPVKELLVLGSIRSDDKYFWGRLGRRLMTVDQFGGALHLGQKGLAANIAKGRRGSDEKGEGVHVCV